MKYVKMKKCNVALALILLLIVALTACGSGKAGEAEEAEEPEAEPVTMMLAAAASLENCLENDLIPAFEKANPGINVEGTYDSSGKLQTQIEEGLAADVFMSAATKQMDALVQEGLVDKDSAIGLLENKLVLIKGKDAETAVTGFEDVTNAEMIAIGDPESVPAGQYAQEALTYLGIYDEVAGKASFGTNVTEVLAWVEQGSAEVGFVYATDAASSDKVEVITEAPEGSLEKAVVYPVGLVVKGEQPEAGKAFLEFLQSAEAKAIFEKYGFAIYG